MGTCSMKGLSQYSGRGVLGGELGFGVAEA